MNEQSNPSAQVMLPVKRRRGRPRKDGGVPKRGSSILPSTPPAPEIAKKAQSFEPNQTDVGAENMVGRMVSGVIDGCFDAGYFLTVRVGNSNTLLRGVVFQPGRFTPISASNDVAPQAKMYQRRDIPVPVPQPDNLIKQPVQLGTQQVLSSKPTSSDAFVVSSQMNQPMPVMAPQSSSFSMGSSFPFGVQIQSQSGHRAENLGIIENDEMMQQVFDLSNQPELPKVGDKADISQAQNQALGSMAQPSFMSYNLEQTNPWIPRNPTPATVSQTVDSESQDVESEPEKSPNQEREAHIESQPQEKTTVVIDPAPTFTQELQFISQEPESAESELKPSDPGQSNEVKSPVSDKVGHTTTQQPQTLESELGTQNLGTQSLHQELMNDAMDFMIEKPTSPKNNAGQHSPEGKPMSGPADNAVIGPQFSIESTGQILTLGIGGSDNAARFEPQFFNPVRGTTNEFGFVLGDFVHQPTGSHANPNNLPETQHR